MPHQSGHPVTTRTLAGRSWVLFGAMLLCAATLVSALSTTDQNWWRLYFSRLGVFGDASSLIFNGGLIGSGLIIACSALSLRPRLTAVHAGDGLIGVRPAWAMSAAIAGLGVSLAGIGWFPLSVSQFAHDRATNGVVLSFAILLILHRAAMWRECALLRIMTVVAASSVLVGMGLLTAGWISLTVFEGIAFGAMLGWVHSFERLVMHRRGVPREARDPADSKKSLSPIWGTRVFGSTLRTTAIIGSRLGTATDSGCGGAVRTEASEQTVIPLEDPRWGEDLREGYRLLRVRSAGERGGLPAGRSRRARRHEIGVRGSSPPPNPPVRVRRRTRRVGSTRGCGDRCPEMR